MKPIYDLKPGTEFTYRGVKYTRTRALCADAKDEDGRRWCFHLEACPDGVPEGQLHDPTPRDEFDPLFNKYCPTLVDGEPITNEMLAKDIRWVHQVFEGFTNSIATSAGVDKAMVRLADIAAYFENESAKVDG
jgi:hypothetical protein